ncbi:MAG: FAD-binding protein, partial [Selenomonadaceae bacterium]|nr:FAD-binding protein [Selenomonadaceae bacterium]
VLADNLSKTLTNAKFKNVRVDFEISSWRDITTIDAARFLEEDDNLLKFAEELKPYAKENAAFIIPQILGTKDGELHKKITEILGAPVVETVCLPPSVNGIRVERIFRRALFDMGVNFVENAKVLRGVTDKGRVNAVVVSAMARDVKYEADKFILATGGFYGGGLALENFTSPHEVIFRLPVWMPDGEEKWSNEKLFGDSPQGFATAGILTDDALRPLDKHKNIVYDNLFVVGRNLGGYDFCFEHSGNGVAIASAYHAAMQEIKEE